MCINCIRSKVDITEGIQRQVVLFQCRGCERYLRPPWTAAPPESKELLALCLKKIRGLKQVKLVDAEFVWTEPHSRRIKVNVTIQKEVFNVVLQQSFVVAFIIEAKTCEDCIMDSIQHSNRAVVQLRQKVEHKRTFFFLEQQIIKANMHRRAALIESQPDGLDFNFPERSDARSFILWLKSVVPVNVGTARQLLSQDFSSNAYPRAPPAPIPWPMNRPRRLLRPAARAARRRRQAAVPSRGSHRLPHRPSQPERSDIRGEHPFQRPAARGRHGSGLRSLQRGVQRRRHQADGEPSAAGLRFGAQMLPEFPQSEPEAQLEAEEAGHGGGRAGKEGEPGEGGRGLRTIYDGSRRGRRHADSGQYLSGQGREGDGGRRRSRGGCSDYSAGRDAGGLEFGWRHGRRWDGYGYGWLERRRSLIVVYLNLIVFAFVCLVVS
ncbi:uncharacterized protein [Blastocystis hominis]|uniref:60S ribosomal export protein NMD3 n=1 Tax=Blastocystis hominis TaxID=12968 RepID=D8LWW3_BLAHO|nr:uncharacterized protein [Blastocystis hominis]CBK20758.2 unnamed protein product [Blastocystis hominis]|eukprot:XP_012894806.1 uncharacterized protein [Blastocystis hominis]